MIIINNLLKIKKLGNKENGFLSFFESEKDISFEIKRVYYTYNVSKGQIRGYHAHKNLEQFLVCIKGKIKINYDNGIDKKSYILDEPNKGVICGKGIWHTMEWLENDSILLVLASEYYDESDYIRDYDEFIKLVKEGYWKDENKL